MKDFRKKALTEQIADRMGDEGVKPRTDYRCAAHGCPNAGVVNDRGEQNRGRCHYHETAPVQDWDRITREIRANESMRNWGIVPVESSAWVKAARAKNANRAARGLRSGSGDAPEVVHYAPESADV